MRDKQGNGTREKAMAALGVSRFLRRPLIYILAHGYATARRDEHPKESWILTGRAFKRRYNIPDEIIDEESLAVELMRMSADFINEGL